MRLSLVPPHLIGTLCSVYPTIDPNNTFSNKAFSGKVALITGASRGIGLETAIYFARAGASLAIVARKKETLEASKAEIMKAVPTANVLILPVDVKNTDEAAKAIASTVEHLGKLDILIANAGRTTRIGDGKSPTILELSTVANFIL